MSRLFFPLEDPRYVPVHQPDRLGGVPWQVERWGPRSQLRWFDRFRGQVTRMTGAGWARFYCSSLLHRGLCCDSCLDDYDEGYDEPYEGHCCCEAFREAERRAKESDQ